MNELYNLLNIKPNDNKYYITAFQHSSYVNENHLKSDYERLEFLGDAVLELVISDYLFQNLEIKEGDMTKLRASYVCENALFEYSKDLQLSKYIKVGHGEEIDGGRYKKVILADIFEALMGAIYLDLGFDTVKRVILGIIVPYIENPKVIFFNDYKSALQEFVQTEQRSLVYEVVSEEGPAHNKSFTVAWRIGAVLLAASCPLSPVTSESEIT